MGAISLRRRWDLSLGMDVYEIKLDDDFLMSSLFTAGETALARLGLAELSGTDLDVVVGGLGLGYTAQRVLEDPRVSALLVMEALGEVIEWHERELLPLGAELASDPRCRLTQGDFFAMFDGHDGRDPEVRPRRFHAILVDIDHSPRHVLHPSHAAFYRTAGLRRLTDHLHPGGVFGLWSNDPPDQEFTTVLAEIFDEAQAHTVEFYNPLQECAAANTIYTARTKQSGK